MVRPLWRPSGWVLGLALVAVAQTQPAQNPKQLRAYAKLEASAAKQHESKKADTLAKLAVLDFAMARVSFHAGDTATALAQLDHVRQHADQAGALLQLEAARGKTSHMRDVEMSLQKITFGLQDLVHDVPLEQQPAVKSLTTRIANLRSQLLQWMFSPKKS
ncbi:MAG: hypothetical protein ACRD1M_02020 [Terriglobales bacterium]